jgi:hypothetical protein
MPNFDIVLNKTDANQNMSTSTQNSTVIDESKSSLLLFDIVPATFIPG